MAVKRRKLRELKAGRKTERLTATDITSLTSEGARAREQRPPTTRRTAALPPTVPLTAGVQSAMDWEVAEATKAAYRRSGYTPQKMSPYRKKMRECSRNIVEDALRTAKGNVARTARSLGIDRDTVYEAVSRK